MKPFLVSERNDEVKLKIVCVGIGAAGCNIIEHMFSKAIAGIDLIAMNTDIKSLEQMSEVKKIQIGSKLLKGSGAEMNPELGKESAIENYDVIKNALKGADIVFILAGLSGGTGTSASPIVAQIAKNIGALTISIVTTPFNFEGKRRLKISESGLENIKKESDSVVVIQSEKLLSLIDKKGGLKDTFKVLDSVVEEVISGIVGVLLLNGENDINLDFCDLETVMSYGGMALVGVGKDEGVNSASKAMKHAIEYALLKDVSLNEASGILIHFTVHTDFPIMEIAEAMEIIHENAYDEADVIWGTTTDSSLSETYVKVTMILAGFDKKYNIANNADYEG